MLSTQSSGSQDGPSGSRRRIAQNACDKCRQRKVKCDGKSPACSSCVSANVECVYEADADRRRKGALRQDIEHLTRQNRALLEENHNLNVITDTIRGRSEKVVEDVTLLLRCNEPVATIVQDIQSGNLQNHAAILRASGASLQGSIGALPLTAPPFIATTTAMTTAGGVAGYTMGGSWMPYLPDGTRGPPGNFLLPEDESEWDADQMQPDQMQWYGQGR